MILKLLKRIQVLERQVKAQRATRGPNILTTVSPYGTSRSARPVARASRVKVKAERPRWG